MTATRLFDRAVVRLSPLDDSEDIAAFLQGLLTNDITGPLPAYAALLSAQGKAMFDLIVWPGEQGAILLDCEAAHAQELVKRLSLYRLRRRIEIVVDESVAVHWRPRIEGAATPDPRLADLGQRWLAPASDSDTAADAEWRAHRLGIGVPEGREELGDVLWLETNAVELHGVSFAKGCYVGQENTARMHYRSKVNRRLVVAPLGEPGERTRATYPDLGLMVEHRRVEALGDALVPAWLAEALA